MEGEMGSKEGLEPGLRSSRLGVFPPLLQQVLSAGRTRQRVAIAGLVNINGCQFS